MKRPARWSLTFTCTDLAYLVSGCVLLGMTLGLLLTPTLAP